MVAARTASQTGECPRRSRRVSANGNVYWPRSSISNVFRRSRTSLQRQQESLTWRQRELAACAQKQLKNLSAVATRLRSSVLRRVGSANASFNRRARWSSC